MKFHVIDHNVRITPKAETMAYLRKDNWNDFSFQTLFRLEVCALCRISTNQTTKAY